MNFINETPWWLPSGLLFLGVILFIAGNNRVERRLMLGGVAVALLGVLAAGVSYLLDSPREMVIKRTRSLMTALEGRDWHTFEQLLHPQVTIVAWQGRQELAEGAQRYTERHELKSVSVLRLNAEPTEPTITVSLQVSADFRDAAALITSWKLEWEESNGRWLLSEIEPLGGPGISSSIIEHYFSNTSR